jgi:hypothetical protein
VSQTSTDLIAGALAEIPNVDLGVLGTFAGSQGSLAKVDVDGVRLTVPMVGQNWPILGDTVRLLRVGKQTLLLGPTLARPTVGRVSATGSPRVTVEYPAGSGVTQLMGYPKGASPVVNDVAVIDWSSGGTVVAFVTAAAGLVAPTDPTPPKGAQQFRQVFTALDSGSYAKGGGLQANDVYASASRRSLWVYGSKIADSIPDSARIDAIGIYLPLLSDQAGNRPMLGTHGNASMPSTSPTIANLTSIANPSGGVPLPTSFGDLLKTGAAMGVGADGAGYAIFRGTQKDGQSGALDITYTV